ncbi:MAG: hypothetical protein KF795_19965 [Labilithrix sp.]|nr:hypothetical protein [Labilithrix sp.]
MIGKKKRKVTEARAPQRISYPVAVLVRMFVIGSVAVIASVWAIWRHYAVPRPPMVVPATLAPSPSEIEIDTSP